MGQKAFGRKIFFLTDIQASPKNIKTCENILEQTLKIVKEEKPFVFVFGGDLFENKRYIDITVFNTIYKGLYEISLWVKNIFLIPGNHDYTVSGESHSLKSMFTFAKICDEPVNSAGFSYDDCVKYDQNPNLILNFIPYRSDYKKFVYDLDLRNNFSKNNDAKNILFFHNEVNGIKLDGHEFKNPLKQELFDGFNFVLGGHIHKRLKVRDNFWYSGSPFQHDFREVGFPGGLAVLEFVDNNGPQLSFREFEFPRFIEIRTGQDIQDNKSYLHNSNINLYINNSKLEEKLKQIAESVRVIPREVSSIVEGDSEPLFSVRDAVKSYVGKVEGEKKILQRLKEYDD